MQIPAHTSSNNLIPADETFSSSVPTLRLFRTKEGKVPFWDDPSVVGGIDRPENYQPRTDMMRVVADFYNHRFHEDDTLILSLVRDAICLNENQLRRLLKGRLTSSRISNRLRTMATFGLTDKWKLRSREETDYLPPSPWSIGVGGYLYLKHMYQEFVMDPSKLLTSGVKAVLRYVSVNEFRTQLYEYQALKGWGWYGVIRQNPLLGKALAWAQMATPQGNIHLLIERLQQGTPFYNHLFTRLNNWNVVFKEEGYLPVMGLPKAPSVLVLSVGTVEMMKEIAEKIDPEKNKIPIWFVVDELLFDTFLPNALFALNLNAIQPIPLSFLKKRAEGGEG